MKLSSYELIRIDIYRIVGGIARFSTAKTVVLGIQNKINKPQ